MPYMNNYITFDLGIIFQMRAA